jgi:RNase P subunit RPR2
VSVRVCPRCGFSHLRPSRARTWLESAQAWWTHTGWFRCETCEWRGRIRDVWSPDTAFPELPPLRLGRELDIEILQQRDEEALVSLVLSHKDAIKRTINLWLDDSRPAPTDWLRVTTVASAQRLLEAQVVREISLDYDLGWCPDCIHRGEHLRHTGQRHCPHTPTGYDLVAWMAQTGHWPQLPPNVHSGNPDGGARMLGVIARHWRGDVRIAPASEEPPPQRPSPAPQGPPPPTTQAAVATLTVCPQCHGPYLQRSHRHSKIERWRTRLSRRFPVRCAACGWTKWVSAPILVRFSSGTVTPSEELDSRQFERIEPDDPET